ncbi:TonB-dependent receptor [Myroides odoratimimus]|uniref:TonB-dependent receptor n=1 Tax=Myroides odoratimimus TaxID=76832 RepID=UPI002578DD4F|nr:TonB-dependent receptor [Myroides odoratimimus]MDM1415723.1 TonB-dependent receptor [Myroides odoratimimus]MDM1448367.1 TonB-dependent receptor [Myroides odoratimimus]MEC4009198.1 TonB-dependent receptor [Myroides odoratimimus]
MKKQFIQGALCIIVRKAMPYKHRILSSVFLISSLQIGAYKAYAQEGKVSLNIKEVTLSNAFKQIESQTKYQFFYNVRDFDDNEKVSINMINAPLSSVLNELLSKKNLFYTVVGDQIVLKKMNNTNASSSRTTQVEQASHVSGLIQDVNGIALVGVTVVIEGTQHGTLSKMDGTFDIALRPDQDVLVFSLLGLKTKRVVLNGRKSINVVLEDDIIELDEILMVGYGQQRREDITGSIARVNTQDILQASIGEVGIDKSLGGLVKGVQVTQSSGRPGTAARLNIRGVTSPLSSYGLNQPLYVIDGVPFNMDGMQGANPLHTLAPSEIESIDILKDAASASIYGSRGANGVIIIQTKRGKRDQKPTVNFSTSTTIANPIKKVNALNARQYREFYDMLIQNSVTAMNKGELDSFYAFDLDNIGKVDLNYDTFQVEYDGLRDEYFGSADTDWNKEVFRNPAYTTQANFGISGGSEKTNYSINLSAIDQQGLVISDKMKQYTLGIGLDTDINKYFKVGGTLNVGHTYSHTGENLGFGFYTLNTSIARARPDLPVYNDNGELLGQPSYEYGFLTLEPNPVMRLKIKGRDKAYNVISNTYIEAKPLENLTLKLDMNAAVYNNKSSRFTPKIADTNFIFYPTDSYLMEDSGTIGSLTTNLTANYKLQLNDHNLSFLLGAAWDYTDFQSDSQSFSGFPDDEILINPSSAETVLSYTGTRSKTGLNSLFSRVTYNYLDRYNATLNFRSDASSKFGPKNKRAYFPSLSVGWNIANEQFMESVSAVNNLRLRASYGSVGSTNVSNFAYLQFFQTSSNNIYNGQSAVVPNETFPNTGIGWETTTEVNTGLDFGLFNSRLTGSIDVYSRKTKDALVRTPFPLELGSTTYYSNFIDISNKGVEISLGGDLIRTNDFAWNLNFNWALNRNKLEKLNGATIDPYLLDYYIEGEPVGTIKGYKVAKIISDQAEIDALNQASPTGTYDMNSTGVGDYLFEDINGDGVITSDDRVVIGNIQPKFFGGFVNSFRYKSLTLNAIFQYSVGAKSIWDPISRNAYNSLGENKYSEYALNTWTPDNPNARYARAIYTDPSASGRISDRYLHSTSYLRLKNVQLSYSFNKELISRIGMDNVTVFVSASNLFTWTKWPGQDPETLSERGSIIDQATAEDPYPLSKSFSFGVQFKF